MSATGIVPDPALGGIVVTSLPAGSGVTNAYIPPSGFTVSGPLTFYGSNCYSTRFDPQQLNAFESEMLALAVAMYPTGTWNIGSVNNLANAFTNFVSHFSGGGSGTVIHASAYPSTSDTAGASPAYVTAAVAAGVTSANATSASALSSAETTITAQIATALASAESYTLAHVPALAVAADYPSDVANDTMTTTPAYVAAAVAAGSGSGSPLNLPNPAGSFSFTRATSGVTQAYAIDNYKGLSIYRTDAGGGAPNVSFIGQPLPSGAFQADFEVLIYALDTPNIRCGPCLYDSTTDKAVNFSCVPLTNGLSIQAYNGLGSYGSTLYQQTSIPTSSRVLQRIVFDGTTYNLYISYDDGLSYHVLATFTTSSIINANYIGIMIEIYGTIGIIGCVVKNWVIT